MRRGFIVATSVVGLLALVYVGVVLLPRHSSDRSVTVVVNKTDTLTLSSPNDPLSREFVTSVFASVGEPLAIRLDFAMGTSAHPSM